MRLWACTSASTKASKDIYKVAFTFLLFYFAHYTHNSSQETVKGWYLEYVAKPDSRRHVACAGWGSPGLSPLFLATTNYEAHNRHSPNVCKINELMGVCWWEVRKGTYEILLYKVSRKKWVTSSPRKLCDCWVLLQGHSSFQQPLFLTATIPRVWE